MHPGPGRRAQRTTCSCPYLRRDSSRCPRELQGPGEPGGHSTSPPSSSLGAINTSLLRGNEGVPPSSSGPSGLVLQGEELFWTPGGEFGLWVCNPPEDQPVWVEGDRFMGALGVDRMEDHPVVEMEGEMEVVDAEFKCRD